MRKELHVQSIFMRLAALGMGLCGAVTVATAAERYPTRPVRFVVGFLPGGPSDTLARVVGAKLSEQLGQAVIVDNRAGAGGNVCAEIVAVSNPDGHTLMLGTGGPFVIVPITGQKVRFDPDRDFAPITKLGDSMSLLAAHPSTGFNHWKDLVAAAKAKPGEINYASSGVGTIHHLAAELLSSMTGIRMNHIPYKGSGAVLPAMLSGEVRVGFGPILPAIPHVKAGRLKALGVGGAKRSGAAPDIPTMAEQGLPGYEASSWYGVFVPAKTPKDVTARLHKELVAAVNAPEVRERLSKDGVDPDTSTPEGLMERVRFERKTWAKVIKDANLKIN
jgi:tripartite-type tricarboxylate transporter receptor subunit TctC